MTRNTPRRARRQQHFSRDLQRVRHRPACCCRDCLRRLIVDEENYARVRQLGLEAEYRRQTERDLDALRRIFAFTRTTSRAEEAFLGPGRIVVCRAAHNQYLRPKSQ